MPLLPFPPGARFRHDPACAWRLIDGQAAILSATTQRIRVLNEVGSRVWELCPTATFAEIVRAVAAEFDVDPALAERDIAEFVCELRDRGMLSVEDAP